MLVFLNSGNVMEKANQQIKPHTRQIQTLCVNGAGGTKEN